MALTEHKLKKRVHDWLRGLVRDGAPMWFLKTHGGAFQRPGLPDYFLLIDGAFVVIELKGEGEKAEPTLAQAYEMERIRRGKAEVHCLNRLSEVQAVVMGKLRRWQAEQEEATAEERRVARLAPRRAFGQTG